MSFPLASRVRIYCPAPVVLCPHLLIVDLRDADLSGRRPSRRVGSRPVGSIAPTAQERIAASCNCTDPRSCRSGADLRPSYGGALALSGADLREQEGLALALSVSVLLAVNVRTQEAIEVERISASGYGGAKEGLAERIAASWLGLPPRVARRVSESPTRRGELPWGRRDGCHASVRPWPPLPLLGRPSPAGSARRRFWQPQPCFDTPSAGVPAGSGRQWPVED